MHFSSRSLCFPFIILLNVVIQKNQDKISYQFLPIQYKIFRIGLVNPIAIRSAGIISQLNYVILMESVLY